MSESEESEISNVGVHSAGVSVSRDTGTKVDLILRFALNDSIVCLIQLGNTINVKS